MNTVVSCFKCGWVVEIQTKFHLITLPLGLNWARGEQTHHCKLFCVQPLKHLACAMIHNYQPVRGGEEPFFFFSSTNPSSVASPFFNTSAHLIAISLVSAALPPVSPTANQLLCCFVNPHLTFPSQSSHLKVNPLIRSACMSLGLDWSQLPISTLSLLNSALYTAVPTLTLI